GDGPPPGGESGAHATVSAPSNASATVATEQRARNGRLAVRWCIGVPPRVLVGPVVPCGDQLIVVPLSHIRNSWPFGPLCPAGPALPGAADWPSAPPPQPPISAQLPRMPPAPPEAGGANAPPAPPGAGIAGRNIWLPVTFSEPTPMWYTAIEGPPAPPPAPPPPPPAPPPPPPPPPPASQHDLLPPSPPLPPLPPR